MGTKAYSGALTGLILITLGFHDLVGAGAAKIILGFGLIVITVVAAVRRDA